MTLIPISVFARSLGDLSDRKMPRNETGKPVTTTEELGDYSSEKLLALGDWIFPNAHPYFQNIKDPLKAVEWTVKALSALGQVLLKPFQKLPKTNNIRSTHHLAANPAKPLPSNLTTRRSPEQGR